MSSLFEEELNMDSVIKFDQKKEIALVTQLPIDNVTKTLSKYEEYKNMHKLLRYLKRYARFRKKIRISNIKYRY